jgi:hypothetical protein
MIAAIWNRSGFYDRLAIGLVGVAIALSISSPFIRPAILNYVAERFGPVNSCTLGEFLLVGSVIKCCNRRRRSSSPNSNYLTKDHSSLNRNLCHESVPLLNHRSQSRVTE